MELILLERVEKLGHMGDVVSVKSGYARNYLLPRGKALRATKDNIAYFEAQKKSLEELNAKQRSEAEKLVSKVEDAVVAVIRQASDGGQLYGSVTSRDIAQDASKVTGVAIDRKMVFVNRSFKMLGLYPVEIRLHPEVKTSITINIARSEEEAKMQEERGEALVASDVEEVAVEAVAEETPVVEAEAETAEEAQEEVA